MESEVRPSHSCYVANCTHSTHIVWSDSSTPVSLNSVPIVCQRIYPVKLIGKYYTPVLKQSPYNGLSNINSYAVYAGGGGISLSPSPSELSSSNQYLVSLLSNFFSFTGIFISYMPDNSQQKSKHNKIKRKEGKTLP